MGYRSQLTVDVHNSWSVSTFCSLFYGMSDGLMTRLQSVQNAAARLVSGARRYNHTRQCFTICTGFRFGNGWTLRSPDSTLVYRLLTGTAPSYLATDCQLVSDEARRQLRSANSRTLVIKPTYSQFGDRCFAAAGPKLLNSFPVQLRQADVSYEQFI